MLRHDSVKFNPLVSIIIPTRNEAQDIARTLEACLKLAYRPLEIIVVDDSEDETPKIVAAYAGRGVRLIHRDENRNGCCGARNLGMQSASGEILLLLNADALPRPDFITQILRHYEEGADYVIVQSWVLNQDCLWARYIHAGALANPHRDPEWSEGFSCRRAAAEKVGYIPGDFPVPFCRDYKFGHALNDAGFRKCVDRTIVMEHISPDRLDTYWRNQVWRGKFAAPYNYYLRKMPFWLVWLRELLKLGRTIIWYALIFPPILHAVRLASFSPLGKGDILRFWLVRLVQDCARTVGNFKGFAMVVRACSLESYQTSRISSSNA